MVSAVGTVVVGFDLETVRPAITIWIPVGWGGGPMGGASGRGRWHSGCGCGNGCCVWEAKSRESRISVSEDFRETFIGGDEFIDSVVFLDGGVSEVVKRYDHLGCLVVGVGGGLVCKRAIASGHTVDVAQFGEGQSPVYLQVVPGLVDDGTTLPFGPCEFHSAAGYGRFGAS